LKKSIHLKKFTHIFTGGFMSFAILILIFFLLYATLSKYDSLLRVVYMTMVVFALTFAFIAYGIFKLQYSESFSLLDTNINLIAFLHISAAWLLADLIVLSKIIKNYRTYVEVNSNFNQSEQAQE